jgi:hypothetical protein
MLFPSLPVSSQCGGTNKIRRSTPCPCSGNCLRLSVRNIIHEAVHRLLCHFCYLILQSGYHFLAANQLSFSRPHFFPVSDMSDRPGSAQFRAFFDSALQDYEEKTGISLSKQPLAEELENRDSVESITAVLRDQAQISSDSQGGDRIIKLMESVVSIICRLSATTALDSAIGMVRQKAPTGISHISDAYTTGFHPCEGDTCGPRCRTRCVCLS